MNKSISLLAASAIAGAALLALSSTAQALGTSDDGVQRIKRVNFELYFEGNQCGGGTFTYDPTLALYGAVVAGCTAQSNPVPGIGIVVKKNWKARTELPGYPGTPCSGTKEIVFEETIANTDGSTEGDTYFMNFPLRTAVFW